VPIGEARRPRRVGHKGAALLAPGNTVEAFDAALAAGVDMIEFDVLSERRDGSGTLFVAHDYHALGVAPARLTLDDALRHLAGTQFGGLELDVDLKLPGYAGRVTAALRDAGLAERALISCTFRAELDLVRRLAPEIRTGWSVPRARRDYTANALTAAPAFLLLHALRAWLPRHARAALAAGRFDAVMAHWRLIGAALVEAVHAGGGELYAWTVDDAALIDRLGAMGVDGVITNDPRLFAAA
jgi:glycerophosphoryl diester phosphodiesterase